MWKVIKQRKSSMKKRSLKFKMKQRSSWNLVRGECLVIGNGEVAKHPGQIISNRLKKPAEKFNVISMQNSNPANAQKIAQNSKFRGAKPNALGICSLQAMLCRPYGLEKSKDYGGCKVKLCANVPNIRMTKRGGMLSKILGSKLKGFQKFGVLWKLLCFSAL